MTYDPSPRPESLEAQDTPPARPDGDRPSGGGDDTLWLIAIGTRRAVDHCRLELHHRGYAEANDWSPPLPGAKPEAIRILDAKHVMRVLVKGDG